MPDFWRSSGFHLLEPASPNRLKVTNGFLRAYLMRPEIRPVSESCAAERGLQLKRASVSSLLSQLKRDGTVIYENTRYKLKEFARRGERPGILVVAAPANGGDEESHRPH